MRVYSDRKSYRLPSDKYGCKIVLPDEWFSKIERVPTKPGSMLGSGDFFLKPLNQSFRQCTGSGFYPLQSRIPRSFVVRLFFLFLRHRQESGDGAIVGSN